MARSLQGRPRTKGQDNEALFHELDRVLDPELDESILQLGFVESLQVERGRVIVELRLPTYWCAPNFAYLMAHDVHTRLSAVKGVESVTVRLKDHVVSESVEAGVNAGKSFADAFPGEGSGNLEALRALFLRKGFIRRQEQLLRCLLEAGLSPGEVCALRVGNVKLEGESCTIASGDGAVLWTGPAEMAQRYLARQAEIGHDSSPQAPLFTDLTGIPVPPDHLGEHLKSTRLVRVSLEANTTMCQVLMAAREMQNGRSRTA